jgi:hypothetical protein
MAIERLGGAATAALEIKPLMVSFGEDGDDVFAILALAWKYGRFSGALPPILGGDGDAVRGQWRRTLLNFGGNGDDTGLSIDLLNRKRKIDAWRRRPPLRGAASPWQVPRFMRGQFHARALRPPPAKPRLRPSA